MSLIALICLNLSVICFNLSLICLNLSLICLYLSILSNKPCGSKPCGSGEPQTVNEILSHGAKVGMREKVKKTSTPFSSLRVRSGALGLGGTVPDGKNTSSPRRILLILNTWGFEMTFSNIGTWVAC